MHTPSMGQGLLRAVGDDDIVGRHIVDAHGLVALGDPCAQGGQALGAAVLQCLNAVFGQDLGGSLLHGLHREGHRVGQPPAKEIRSGEAAAARMLAVNSPWKSGRMIFSDMCTVISNSS